MIGLVAEEALRVFQGLMAGAAMGVRGVSPRRIMAALGGGVVANLFMAVLAIRSGQRQMTADAVQIDGVAPLSSEGMACGEVFTAVARDLLMAIIAGGGFEGLMAERAVLVDGGFPLVGMRNGIRVVRPGICDSRSDESRCKGGNGDPGFFFVHSPKEALREL